MKVEKKSIEQELVEMASTIDLETDVIAAFAEMDEREALEAIDTRLRETRAFIKLMEDKIYLAKKAVVAGRPS